LPYQLLGKFNSNAENLFKIVEQQELKATLEKQTNHLSDIVKEWTKDLADAQERLTKSERLAAMGELAGMVCPDLRNPEKHVAETDEIGRQKLAIVINLLTTRTR
jgi:hypothetical protein